MLDLDDYTISTALLLHEEKVPIERIAARLKINRSTLEKVLQRPDAYRANHYRKMDSKGPTIVVRNPIKCRECGYFVQMPCLVCSTRKYKRLKMLKVS